MVDSYDSRIKTVYGSMAKGQGFIGDVNLFRLIIRPSCRPPYASCWSVCPVRAFNSLTKKRRKNQNWRRCSQRHESVECQFSVRKVRGQGHRT